MDPTFLILFNGILMPSRNGSIQPGRYEKPWMNRSIYLSLTGWRDPTTLHSYIGYMRIVNLHADPGDRYYRSLCRNVYVFSIQKSMRDSNPRPATRRSYNCFGDAIPRRYLFPLTPIDLLINLNPLTF